MLQLFYFLISLACAELLESQSTFTDATNLPLLDKIVVSGDYIYASSSVQDDYFAIISTAGNMGYSGRFESASLLGDNNALAVSGNNVYIVSSHHKTLHVFDVSDKANPQHVSSLADPILRDSRDIVIKNDHAYISCYSDNALLVVDVSNKASPTKVANNPFQDNQWDQPSKMAVSGDLLYITSGHNALIVYDISSPAAPSLNTVTTGGTGCNYKGGDSIVASGSYLVFAAGDNVVSVNPATGAQVSCISNSGASDPEVGYVSDDVLFVIGADASHNQRVVPVDLGTLAYNFNEALTAIASTASGTLLSISGSGDDVFVLDSKYTVHKITITFTATQAPASSTSASSTSDTTEAATEEETTTTESTSENFTGNLTWWGLVLITIVLVAFCVPLCAHVNKKYVRPIKVARQTRVKEQEKMEKARRRTAASHGDGEGAAGFE